MAAAPIVPPTPVTQASVLQAMQLVVAFADPGHLFHQDPAVEKALEDYKKVVKDYAGPLDQASQAKLENLHKQFLDAKPYLEKIQAASHHMQKDFAARQQGETIKDYGSRIRNNRHLLIDSNGKGASLSLPDKAGIQKSLATMKAMAQYAGSGAILLLLVMLYLLAHQAATRNINALMGANLDPTLRTLKNLQDRVNKGQVPECTGIEVACNYSPANFADLTDRKILGDGRIHLSFKDKQTQAELENSDPRVKAFYAHLTQEAGSIGVTIHRYEQGVNPALGLGAAGSAAAPVAPGSTLGLAATAERVPVGVRAPEPA